jgi:hypothetical protein
MSERYHINLKPAIVHLYRRVWLIGRKVTTAALPWFASEAQAKAANQAAVAGSQLT